MIIQQRLDALKELAILDTPSDSTFENLTQITKSLFDVPIVLVSLIDKNRQWFKSHIGLDVCELPLEGAFCPHALESEALFIVEDALLDPHFKSSQLVTGEPYIRFYAGAPIRTENGIAIGTLCIIDTKPRQQRQAKQIVRSGNHLLNLINEVLDLTRIEAGHTPVSIESIDVRKVLNDSIELMAPLITQQQLQLRINTNACQTYFVHADYTRLKQILINLLSNAIKYNRPQGSITIQCTADEELAHIDIHDTGIGIDPSQLDAIFEPFHRSIEPHSNVEGTGVGLALCKKLARLMHTDITVKSTVGEGSCFSLSLPLANPRLQESS